MASAEVQMAINEDFNTTLTKEPAIKQTYTESYRHIWYTYKHLLPTKMQAFTLT